jgi:thiol-disulfide isomerase/thioredoxin
MKKHQQLFKQIGLGLVSAIAISQVNTFNNNLPLGIQIANAQPTNAAVRQQPQLVVARIHADWCSKCRALAPVMTSLQQRYQNIQFVTFDVTNRSTLQAAQARARELKLTSFLDANKSRPSTVALINSVNGQTVKQFFNNNNQQEYVNSINGAIAQIQRR